MSNWSSDVFYLLPMSVADSHDADMLEHSARLLSALRLSSDYRTPWIFTGARTFELGLIISGDGRDAAGPDFGDEFWAVADTGIVVCVHREGDELSLYTTIKGQLAHVQKCVPAELTYYEGEEDTPLYSHTDYNVQRWDGRTPEERAAMAVFWDWYDDKSFVPTPEEQVAEAVAALRALRVVESFKLQGG